MIQNENDVDGHSGEDANFEWQNEARNEGSHSGNQVGFYELNQKKDER